MSTMAPAAFDSRPWLLCIGTSFSGCPRVDGCRMMYPSRNQTIARGPHRPKLVTKPRPAQLEVTEASDLCLFFPDAKDTPHVSSEFVSATP